MFHCAPLKMLGDNEEQKKKGVYSLRVFRSDTEILRGLHFKLLFALKVFYAECAKHIERYHLNVIL